MRTSMLLERRLAAALVVAVAMLASSCGLFSHSVAADAAKYYDFMLGLSPGTKFTSFYSPAYLKGLPTTTRGLIDNTMSHGSKKNDRQTPVDPKDIRSATQANFAITTASNKAGYTVRTMGPTKWVRDGGRWYLYFGNDTEIKAYGEFPPSLQLPPEAPASSKAHNEVSTQ